VLGHGTQFLGDIVALTASPSSFRCPRQFLEKSGMSSSDLTGNCLGVNPDFWTKDVISRSTDCFASAIPKVA